MSSITYIYYLHYGNNIPVYVGKSVNPQDRKSNHRYEKKKKYFIEIIDSVPTNEWKFWEEHYIWLFKSWGFELENKSLKGRGCVTHKVSIQARLKISQTHKGKLKPFSKEHKENHKNAYKNRQVTWGNNISNGLKGRKNTWGGGGKKGSSVLQYDLDGNFIKKWNSVGEPSKFYNCYVSGVLNGKQKQAGGFVWKYE